MRTRIVTAGIIALALSAAACADDIAPGLWELSLEARVESEPGFQPGPMTVNQCVAKADAGDPGKLLAPIATAGATGCSYLQKSYSGQTFRFAMQCSGALELRTSGEVTFSASGFRGTLTTSSVIEGSKVEFKSALTGRRLGDC
jgi:hypothetical protein